MTVTTICGPATVKVIIIINVVVVVVVVIIIIIIMDCQKIPTMTKTIRGGNMSVMNINWGDGDEPGTACWSTSSSSSSSLTYNLSKLGTEHHGRAKEYSSV